MKLEGLSEDVREAVLSQIAASVLAGLKQEHRDAILAKGIAESLGSYSFKNAVERAVVAEGERAAAEMLKSPEWRQRINTTVSEGMADFLVGLRQALPEALLEAMAGTEGGTYSRGPGLLLKYMPKDK